jgi:hypothetical protein
LVLIASLVLEYDLLSIRQLIIIYGALLMAAGISWTVTVTVREKSYQQELADIFE